MTWVTFIATEKNTNGSIYENIILLLTTPNNKIQATLVVTLLEATTIENKGFTTSKNASIDGNLSVSTMFLSVFLLLSDSIKLRLLIPSRMQKR
jgi:hypothetical protein